MNELSVSSFSTPVDGASIIQSAKKRVSILDYDIEEIMKRPRKIEATQSNYDHAIAKFMEFLLKPYSMMSREDFSDSNIAIYIMHLGSSNNWKPHFRKNTLAAINNQLLVFGLENIHEFKHKYHATNLVLNVSYLLIYFNSI